MTAEERAEFQQQRIERGARQFAEYRFERTPAGTWLCHKADGTCYTVTEHSCSCPDAQYRSGPAGVPCKHRVALQIHRLLTK